MRIFCGHDDSGCAWYRMLLPMRELEKHGYDVTYASGDVVRGNGFTTAATAGHDVVVGERLDNPRGVHVWRECRTPTSRLVYELDDDVFSIGPDNWNAYHVYRQELVRDTAIHSMEVADLVTTTVEPLAEVLREFNPNVRVLPNMIPGYVCDIERTRRERPCVGWMGGASHGLDIGVIADPVRRFLRRFPGWDLRLVGTDYRATFKAPKDQAVFSRWIQVQDNPEGFYRSMDFDIGLAPLLPSPVTQAKSAIKALEYAALGIPVIATDWGPYPDFIRHGETGFLVKRDHEWLQYLSMLASDAELREGMGQKARALARENTYDEGWRMWADAYESLFTRSR
jgi:hypothetical protein